MASTRQKCNIYLIGISELEPLTNVKQLPTIKQVLQRFHEHLKEMKSVRNASHTTVAELQINWTKAGIPTMLKTHVIEKLEKLHETWLLLKKNKGRQSEAQKRKEFEFATQLNQLFDIACADALSTIKIDQDKHFLSDQRSDRKMIMTIEDKELAAKQQRSEERQQKHEERKRKASQSRVLFPAVDDGQSDESESSDADNKTESDTEYHSRAIETTELKDHTQHIKKTSRDQLFNADVTSALDRNKTSDREAVRLLIPIAAALGHDPDTLPISRSTIKRARTSARHELSKKTFNPTYPLVLHWDGKILPEIFGKGSVDRLPVLVSGDGNDKLLGVPKVSCGTAENEANAVYRLLEKWQLLEKIQAMSFDTTSVNTGRLNGVCVGLENRLGRELNWLACRHHVMEIILSKAFTICCGPSNSPDIPLFKRFKACWDAITRQNFSGLQVTPEVSSFSDTTIAFLSTQCQQEQARDDYMELIELTLIVLGLAPSTIHWRAPGPVHRARWMAKLIYAMKMYVFRSQQGAFRLTKKEEAQIERFVKFGALIYTRAWIAAPLATEAPAGDLQLWVDLGNYQSIDPEISRAARKILENHLWYLSDELVGLALFSDLVTAAEKKKIVQGMTRQPGERKVRGDSSILLKPDVCLGDFATTRTADFLCRYNVDNTFLLSAPQQWPEIEQYRSGQARLKMLRVVNDTAERAVKLFEEYNSLLTNDEEEKQLLLQVVEANRKAVPTETTKRSTIQALNTVRH